ncbi:MAG: hypothetical protein V3V96_14545, partial [Acidiferrobacterales bacterium]
GPEWARQRTYLTADAQGIVNLLRAGDFVHSDRIDRACLHAPCLITLRASVGNGGAPVFELEDFNARFGRIEHALVFEGTRHFAL